MSESVILDVKQLSKRYGDQQALNNFDLTIYEGEIVGIAGPNGAGKTTLFRIITGLTPLYQGDISLFGSHNSQTLQHNRTQLGTIIEDPAFFPEMSAQQNLEFYRKQRGVKDKRRIEELLRLVGLASVDKKKYKSFSLGMKQRLAIALSLIHSPKLLIFDEPTNGLDPSGIIQVRELLIRLAKEANLTIIVSSHILSELENLATRFVIINHGNKIEEFTKESLSQRVQNYLEIQVDQIDLASNLLKETFNIKQIEVEDTNVLKVFTNEVEASAIAKLLIDNDIKLSHLARKTYHLEELFMDLTKAGEVNE